MSVSVEYAFQKLADRIRQALRCLDGEEVTGEQALDLLADYLCEVAHDIRKQDESVNES